MSERTIHRRRKAAGLVKPFVPATFNKHFFDEWSDEMAWLLGLIWSDGHLTNNMVEICSKDYQLVDLVYALIDGGRGGTKNGGKHLRLTFTSPHTAGVLRKLGLTERKSLTIGWPIGIPPEYEGAFVRGLIDGDGSVLWSMNRKGQQAPDLAVQLVSASSCFVEAFADWHARAGVRFRVHKRTHSNPKWNPVWAFVCRHQDSLRALHRMLYPVEDVPCLHRKRVPFDLWMQTPRARPGRKIER
jgi:intein/homing endonuclease